MTLVFLAHAQTTGIFRALVGSTLALAALTVWLLPVAGASGAAFAALAAEVVQSVILALHYGRLGRTSPASPEPQYGLSTQ